MNSEKFNRTVEENQASKRVEQQYYYQQPPQQYPPYYVFVKPPRQKVPGRGFGITSMILGIIGLVSFFYIFIASINVSRAAIDFRKMYPSRPSNALSGGLIYDLRVMELSGAASVLLTFMLICSVFAILSLAFARSSRKKGYRNGVSTSGIVLSSVSILIMAFSVVVCIPVLMLK